MALIGVSLIVASVVLFCLRRPAWLPSFFRSSQPPPRLLPGAGRDSPPPTDNIELQDLPPLERHVAAPRISTSPPPPPTIHEPPSPSDEQSTPKASAAAPPRDPIPSLSLSATPPPPPTFGLMAPPPKPGTMAPPPRPAVPRLQPQPYARAAGSSTLPLPNRPGGGPLPNRGGGLAPPPTHTTKPAKPSKEVALAPGHSPLDWARLSSSPHADLAGVGGSYLRVTPSLLKKMTGRRGKDAWTVLGGRVYNITPYLPFHPGGEPELLRGAGRDGTKMFGEVHPWVNYEGMLGACLVGVMVGEEEGEEIGGGGMEDMD